MASTISYKDERLDEVSQLILQILRDLGGEVDASTLREECGVDNTEQIHYRVRNYLAPTGLVEKVGVDNEWRNGRAVTRYRLTGEGEAWVDANQDELLDAVASAKAVESVTRMQDKVQDFEGRLEELEGDVEELDNLENRVTTRVSRIKKTANEVEEALSGRARVERVSEVEDDVEEIRKDVDAIQDSVASFESRVSEVEGRMDELEEKMRQSFDRVDEKLEALYKQQQELIQN